jgi:dolichol-phosphate mannosyltransferase
VSRGRGLPRWAAFAGVGIMGFGIQLAALQLLTATAGLATARATAIAVEAAVLHNFVWHERWTWRDRAGGGPAHLLGRLARFHAGAGIVSLAGNVAITVVLVEWLQVPVVLANACAVGVVSVLNFHLSDRWVFPGQPDSPSARDDASGSVDGFTICEEQAG